MKLKSLKPSHWKDGFWNRLIKCSRTFLSDESYLKLKFKHTVGYPLNLASPHSFCEKLQWLKLNDTHLEYTQMVDKATAKEYVASIIGEKYIIPTLGIWNSIDEIEWEKLPNQFVIKSTGDSGGVVVCKDKTKFDKNAAIKKLKSHGESDYYHYNLEYPYKNVPHRYIAEEYMEDECGSELKDYKFFCFNGHAVYCQVIANRTIDETIDFYDREWEHQPFIGLNPIAHHALINHLPPKNYNVMFEIADKLSTCIAAPFVRIDLYNVNSRIYFGEITFFPASGMGKFVPLEWDYKLGGDLILPIS